MREGRVDPFVEPVWDRLLAMGGEGRGAGNNTGVCERDQLPPGGSGGGGRESWTKEEQEQETERETEGVGDRSG